MSTDQNSADLRRGVFWSVERPNDHVRRAKAIVAKHPEVRKLFGRNPWTAALCLGFVASQAVLAGAVAHMGAGAWLAALASAWFVGAFLNHALYVVIHDATHDLVFRRRLWNKLLLLLADLPNLAPGALAFRSYHLQHHSHLGELKRDPDLPASWEVRAFAGSSFGKAVWLLLFPLMQALRAMNVGGSKLRDVWFFANLASNAAFAIAMYFIFGSTALLYLFASFWFSIGPHPLGARWIQEHFTLDPGQETGSYYGPLNAVTLNIGFHNEHHDFPAIPWNRLPALKNAAPEFYAPLAAHRSWSGLFLQFLTDSRYSLASRVVRPLKDPAA